MWFCIPDHPWLSWSLCSIALLFVTIAFCWFLFSLFLRFALHNIHAFHSRLFFVIFNNDKKIKKKNKKKGSKMCFALFSWIWNQGWQIYFYITCLCTLFSLDELIYCTHYTSYSLLNFVHVIVCDLVWPTEFENSLNFMQNVFEAWEFKENCLKTLILGNLGSKQVFLKNVSSHTHAFYS